MAIPVPLLWAGGALGIGAVAYYAFSRDSAPAAEPALDMTGMMPAMFYGGGGSGGGFGGIPELSEADLVFPEFPEPEGFDSSVLEAMFRYNREGQDAWALASLGLTGNQSAYLGRDGNNAWLQIFTPPKSRSSAEIREFVLDQQARGVPINSASILNWSNKYGVSIGEIGAAFGKTQQQSYDWLLKHDAVAPKEPVRMSTNYTGGTSASTGSTGYAEISKTNEHGVIQQQVSLQTSPQSNWTVTSYGGGGLFG